MMGAEFQRDLLLIGCPATGSFTSFEKFHPQVQCIEGLNTI